MLKCIFTPGSVTRKPVSGVPVLGQALVFVPRVAGEPGPCPLSCPGVMASAEGFHGPVQSGPWGTLRG